MVRPTLSPATPKRTIRYRVANALIASASRHRPIRRSLDSVTSMLDAATGKTDLNDWGDEGFITPLRILIDSFNREANLTALGRFFIQKLILKKLTNRLCITRDLQRYPQALDTAIERPIFILGLPRTGTTLIHRILAKNSALRSLQYWELISPSPPPDPLTYRVDPRRSAKRTELWLARHLLGPSTFSDMASIHSFAVDDPEECVHLLMNTLMTSYFAMYGRIPQYFEWLRHVDLTPAYHEYRQQLQLLKWRFPRTRLLLKAPLHLKHLKVLLKVFPDATLIQIHRDPVMTVPSICSTRAHHRAIFSDHVDRLELGRETLELLGEYIDQSIAVHHTLPQDRVIDLYYDDLIRDPFLMASEICQRCDVPMDHHSINEMIKWPLLNPPHKHGKHRYNAETFGLSPRQIRRDLARYCEFYGFLKGTE